MGFWKGSWQRDTEGSITRGGEESIGPGLWGKQSMMRWGGAPIPSSPPPLPALLLPGVGGAEALCDHCADAALTRGVTAHGLGAERGGGAAKAHGVEGGWSQQEGVFCSPPPTAEHSPDGVQQVLGLQLRL